MVIYFLFDSYKLNKKASLWVSAARVHSWNFLFREEALINHWSSSVVEVGWGVAVKGKSPVMEFNFITLQLYFTPPQSFSDDAGQSL